VTHEHHGVTHEHHGVTHRPTSGEPLHSRVTCSISILQNDLKSCSPTKADAAVRMAPRSIVGSATK
jgi:hypothetical protein